MPSPTQNDSGQRPERPSTSPFETMSDTTLSRSESYHQLLEMYLYTPIRILWSDWRARIGSIILILYVFMGTIGVFIVRTPQPNHGPRQLEPFQSLAYPLGTDSLGQGIFAQIVHSTPTMLEMLLTGAIFGTVLAVVVGTVSGYRRGRTDKVLMTITDIVMTIPGLPLVIVLSVILQPKSPFFIGIILVINAWAGLARSIRSQVLTIREESYVEASKIMGAPTHMILSRDILSNIMPYVAVNFVSMGRQVIFASVGLYFLGILPFTNLNWGVMMNLAYTTAGALYTWKTAYWLIAPMFAIVLLMFGMILFAQGADRLFNPRVRARHAETITSDDNTVSTESTSDETVPTGEAGGL